MSEILESLPPIAPLHFFTLSLDVPKGKKGKKLPRTSEYLAEEHFGDVTLRWDDEGIWVQAVIDKKFEEATYPDFSKGDALELFFDTRDMKNAGFLTRFCHHFVILPQPVQGVLAQEITRLRADDTRPLCDPSEIETSTTFSRNGYTITAYFPSRILYGFDPQNFDRLGFTYRIHRYRGLSQNFSSKTNVEQNSSGWATLCLQ